MVWRIEVGYEAAKIIEKLGWHAKRRINNLFVHQDKIDNPHVLGKQLKGDLRKYWCYRAGDYRVLCVLDEKKKVIKVIDAVHRKEIYD